MVPIIFNNLKKLPSFSLVKSGISNNEIYDIVILINNLTDYISL